jgi:acetamidase/formamidase
MEATLRLTVEKNMPWVKSPHYVAPPRRAEENLMGEYAALGVAAELREATRDALKGLMAWLQGEKGLTKEESYVLASVAGNLKMVEVVDMPNYVVACAIPLSIFRY